MKKNILFGAAVLFATVAFVYFFGGLLKNTWKNADDISVTLKAGTKTAVLSFADLGAKVEIEPARFGLAALLNGEKTMQRKVSIDTNKLLHAVLSFFPNLNSPEKSHASFFIVEENQKILPTFNLRKLASQIEASAVRNYKLPINIEVIPEEEAIVPEEESDALPEEISEEIIPEEELARRQQELQEKTLKLHIEGGTIPKLNWTIPLNADDWVLKNPSGVSINHSKLETFFKENVAGQIERPVSDALIKQFIGEGKAVRVEVEGVAEDGAAFPLERNLDLVEEALLAGNSEVRLEIQIVPARILNETGLDLGNLELIGLGRSNFAGSPGGRTVNIQKGLRDRMNNIIVPPGASFSFNDFLGDLRAADGWKYALGIFGGNNLKPTLGGGLCQVSTTVYRAALNAGLKIIERQSHSLYVKYYKDYGEGLDATIFVGGQDLVFLNDTPSYIFIQSYDDGDDAYVKIYGTSDGRTVSFDGPYRTHNTPEGKAYKPAKNEIAWFRTITRPDGTQEQEIIVSRYRVVPHH